MSHWRIFSALALAGLLLPLSLTFTTPAQGAVPKDYDVDNGHFFSQANGDDRSPWGYTVSDNGGDKFWSEFKRYGGVPIIGYPISNRFLLDGFPTQAFQKAVLQYRASEGRAVFVNVFDLLNTAGRDDWLRTVRMTPNKTIPEESPGVPIETITANRQKVLDVNTAIKNAYFGVPNPVLQYGLPTSKVEDLGQAYVVRFQRAVIQQWKIDVPWAKANDVTVANGGDIFKESGQIDVAPSTARSAPGYETQGPAPAIKAIPTIPKSVAVPASASAAVPVNTPAPGSSTTNSALVRQIDAVKRTQPAHLEQVPGAKWAIIKLHQHTACENAWLGIGFLEAQDMNGKDVDGITIQAQSGETIVDHITGTKGPGKVEAYFYRGNWTTSVIKDLQGPTTSSDKAIGMDTLIFAQTPEEQAARYCNGVEAITTGHISYDVVFRQTRP
jgi:hypothetical protein